jgi:hypothetical protein
MKNAESSANALGKMRTVKIFPDPQLQPLILEADEMIIISTKRNPV